MPVSMPRGIRRLLPLLIVVAGCRPPTAAEVTPEVAQAAQTADAIAISDELESLIASGKDKEEDRVFALDQIRAMTDDGSAAHAFARAAVAGRVAELRGVKAGKLVSEAESYAQKSIDRDPQFRDRAAARMLGSLWVMAPPRLLEHGDSEEGLTLLESLAEEQPDEPLNHLRVAEAYVFLGDPEPAIPHLCQLQSHRDGMRPDFVTLLDRLLEDAADEGPIECDEQAAGE